MAVKQGIFNEYIKEREGNKLKEILTSKIKYSHNRVFDEPNYLKEGFHNSKEKLSADNGTQTVDNVATVLDTNGTQAADKNYKNPTLTNLVGLQRKLVLIMYQNCSTYGSKVTQEMTVEHLAHLAKCNKNSIKTTISRLKKKKCIALAEYKDGRSGWSKYEINYHLYRDISQ